MRIINISFLIWLLTLGCSNGIKTENQIISIDLEANADKMEVVNLSQFTDNIHYVPLQSEGSEPFTFIGEADFLDNYMLIHGNLILTLYDTSGKYIRNIGSIGRGPGEYQLAFIIGITKDGKIFLKQLGDLYEYSIDGTFIDKNNGFFNVDNQYYMDQVFLVDDSLFLGYIPNANGQLDYNALIINRLGEIKHKYVNYIKFVTNTGSVKVTNSDACFHTYNNEFYFKEIFNDTLFILNHKYELIPKYVLNLGKFKLPDSERSKKMEINRMDYFFVEAVYQTDDYLFVDCSFGSRFPAKRLTPFAPLPGGYKIWYSTTVVLGVYNKKTGDFVFSKPTSTDNFMFTTGLYNDIDAGPRFRPDKMVNDSTMVMWVPANELKAHVASDDFKNNTPKFPEKKKQLKELADKLNDFDNTVLMFVIFK